MKRIILVDDDRTNSNLSKILLEMDGFQVTVSPTLALAYQAAAQGVDAFIVDCNLAQDDDGIDLLRAIRQGETAANVAIPVIITSGDSRREKEATAEGANIFMLKPYPPSALSQQLNKLLTGVANG
jgi:DNA-binding response OmpR family regulator